MGKKIHGKFAPLTQELGEDSRFIVESTDLDKLLYILIIFTCHMTNHQAPIDPRFYKSRFRLRAKNGQIAASLRRVTDMYPKLSWGEKKLSLINSATYEIQSRTEKKENKKRLEERGEALDLFETFWKSYPRKVAKEAGIKAFKKLSLKNGLFEKIMAALEIAKKSASWEKDGGQFIPHPATFLNGKRWEDDYSAESKNPKIAHDAFVRKQNDKISE